MDGYFDHQSPRRLLKDEKYRYLRRVWAKGTIDVLKPLKLNHEYQCQERIEYIKRIRGDHYVCIERSIFGSVGDKVLKELRTLVYTNSPAMDQTPVKIDRGDGTLIGKFTFKDLDIVIYGGLSSNPHRIHWDRVYSQTVEGYRDIIVQGPFALQILLKFAQCFVESPITRVSYRNYNYIYPDTDIDVCLVVENGQYRIWMSDSKMPEIILLEATISCQ